MSGEQEYGTKARLLRIMLAIMASPNIYTKKRLSEIYTVSEDTIKHDIGALRQAGFVLESDTNHRYYFKEEKPFRQLKDLLHFSDEDQDLLSQAIDQIAAHSKRGDRLKKKLSSLYDYKRLGHAYLRKPYLSKVDTLLEAKANKQVVVLEEYRSSNSNNIEDRTVEPFHVSPAEDVLQAFDLDKKAIRHFRISRFVRVRKTGQGWQHEGHHNIMRTDPFRIVSNDQVPVHLRLGIGAYNELLERFPLSRSYLLETDEEEVFDFQCNVNSQFIGLTNFVLGNYHLHIEVVSPDQLIDHLHAELKKIKF
jgi:predicted DNA-binding transcriptional regulator YafY